MGVSPVTDLAAVHAAWSAVARGLGGPDLPLPLPVPLRFAVVVPGDATSAVEVEVRGQEPRYPQTRIRAARPGPPRLRLRVRHGYLYPVGRMLGIQDISVGDAAFDERFLVKANDEDYARAWLGPEVRDLILGASEYEYVVGRAGVEALRPGLDEDARALEHAVRAVAALCTQGERLLDGWRESAATLGGRLRGSRWAVDGSVAIAVEAGGTPATISGELAGRGGGLVTRVACRRLDADGDPWALALRDGGLRPPRGLAELAGAPAALARSFRLLARDPERLRGRLRARACEALQALRPPLVVSDGTEVAIVFGGWVADAGRLRAALAVTAELAEGAPPVPAGGPYR